MRQTTLSKRTKRTFQSAKKDPFSKKKFRVAQVSVVGHTKLETSALSIHQKERLTKGFRTNQSAIHNKDYFGSQNNSQGASAIFRSEIVGVNESKLLMKKKVGNFSRLNRFRTRNKSNNKLSNNMISKPIRNQNRGSNMADSVFDSINKCKLFFNFNNSSKSEKTKNSCKTWKNCHISSKNYAKNTPRKRSI